MTPKTKLTVDSPARAPEPVHLARGSPPRPSHMVHAGSALLALKQRYSPPLQRKHLPDIGQQNELDPRFPQQMPGCCLYARAQLPPGAQQDSHSEEARTVAMARSRPASKPGMGFLVSSTLDLRFRKKNPDTRPSPRSTVSHTSHSIVIMSLKVSPLNLTAVGKSQSTETGRPNVSLNSWSVERLCCGV